MRRSNSYNPRCLRRLLNDYRASEGVALPGRADPALVRALLGHVSDGRELARAVRQQALRVAEILHNQRVVDQVPADPRGAFKLRDVLRAITPRPRQPRARRAQEGI